MNTLAAAALAAIVAVPVPGASAVQDGPSKLPPVRNAMPLSAAAGAQLAKRALEHPDLPQRQSGHKLAAIRVTAEETAGAGAAKRTLVGVVFFDHTALEARRLLFDPSTNELLLNERLPGRPQRSEDELSEAIAIIRRDPALAQLVADGGVLDGGFIVDDPGGSRRRMIQLKLMSADRRALLRSIVVDLTLGAIAVVSEGGR